jgi:hypothetical protein
MKLTNSCFLIIGLIVQVIGVELNHLSYLLGLMLIEFDRFPIQGMFNNI